MKSCHLVQQSDNFPEVITVKKSTVRTTVLLLEKRAQ